MQSADEHPIVSALGCLFVVIFVVAILFLAGQMGLGERYPNIP